MIYASLESFRCHTETDEVGADEPYMLVAAVDLKNTVQVGAGSLRIPASRVVRYGPFADVDAQETHQVPFQPFWGLNGEERPLSNPDDVIFLVGLMENDDGDPENLRGIVSGIISGTLGATMGADRSTIVSRLLQDMNSALSTITGAPNFDDQVGFPREVRFTPGDIAVAETGNTARQSIRVQGDGGDYTMTFAARNRGQAAWRFCNKCNTMFFDGFASKGVCPGGGGHVAQGFMFFLPHDHAGPFGGQNQWRFCNKCHAMFFNGFPGGGTCPAGGGHNAQGFEFFLPHDHGGPGQDQWRFCDKCRVMFYNGFPTKGRCPAGGGHNAQGFNFRLDFTP